MPAPVAVVFVLLVMVVVAIQVALAAYAYGRLGLGPIWAYATLLGSIIGSRFNIALAHLRGPTTYEAVVVRSYGMWYVVPRPIRRGMRTLAMNVGGAVIPTALAGYLIVHAGLGWSALLGVALVSTVVHAVARLVPGVGIVVPTFVPPAAAALVAWALPAGAIGASAYVAGTLGTLIGADLLNLHRVRDLDAPMMSIGGAGTFDGIFVTGIIAVLLATL